jgi:hypothetical protein
MISHGPSDLIEVSMTGEMNARIPKQAQGTNDRAQSFPQREAKLQENAT